MTVAAGWVWLAADWDWQNTASASACRLRENATGSVGFGKEARRCTLRLMLLRASLGSIVIRGRAD